MTTQFRNICFLEVKKSLYNRMCFIGLGIGLIFTIISAFTMIGVYYDWIQQYSTLKITGNTLINRMTVYNFWIGGEAQSQGYVLFYFLLPLLSCFPYSWSYSEEKNGYIINQIVKSKKSDYYVAKYIACFISGGLVILIPLIVNFCIVAMCVPARVPEVSYNIYNGVFSGNLFSELYYTMPFVYVLFFMILNFIFGGLFSCMGFTIGMFLKKKASAVIVTYIGVMFWHYGRTFFYYKLYDEVSPIYFLHASSIENHTNGWIILGEGIILVLITIFTIWIRGVRKDVL